MSRSGQRRPASVAGVAVLLTLAAVSVGEAADFRLDNAVYVADQPKPVSQTTTLFQQGVVYDFLTDPVEVVVFEREAGRAVLLDVSRQVRTSLATRQVAAFTESLQRAAAGQEDPFLRFLAQPTFEEQYAAAERELTLASPWLTYRLRLLQPDDPSVVTQCREFSDWSAQINALLNPGRTALPYPRLHVNAALAQRGALAAEVRLHQRPKQGEARVLRSRHQFQPQLTDADRNRIAQARKWMRTFTEVGIQQYRKAAE